MTIIGTLKVTTPTDREIVMTRVFDAPRGLVWDAMTRPDGAPHGHGLRRTRETACDATFKERLV